MSRIETSFLKDSLSKIADSKELMQNLKSHDESSSKTSFMDHLKEAVGDVNKMQVDADKLSVDVSTGKSGNLHEAMLAMSQAQLGFNFVVQVRNKALEAYNEVMRMQV